jgi:hypothetical protein
MSPDAAWKALERRVAKLFGGRRRGPDTTGGKTDIVCQGWAVECKLLSRPSFSDLLAACRQAERNAEPRQIPVAVVKKKHAPDSEILFCMRLSVAAPWFLPAPDPLDCEPPHSTDCRP